MKKFKCDQPKCKEKFENRRLLGLHKWRVHGIHGPKSEVNGKAKKAKRLSVLAQANFCPACGFHLAGVNAEVAKQLSV